MNFNEVYLQMLKELWYKGKESSPRGMKIKELIPYFFEIDERDKIITLPGFETNIKYAEEELLWYYSGTNEITFSPLIERTWKQFSDDGIHVNSAYGHRMFTVEHPDIRINQWDWCLQKLREDRDSRQAVINLNLPSDKEKPTKDFCCTMYAQIFIRDNKLHWITNIRSTDIRKGIRNDVYCFMSMQQMMAQELNVEVGNYYQFCGSLHLYEEDFERARKLFEGE